MYIVRDVEVQVLDKSRKRRVVAPDGGNLPFSPIIWPESGLIGARSSGALERRVPPHVAKI